MLKLRSFMARPDWYIELCDALEDEDWSRFAYILSKDPSLAQRDVMSRGRALTLAIEADRLEIVQNLKRYGVDLEAAESGVAPFPSSPRDPGFHEIPRTTLASAWLAGATKTYEWLLKEVTSATRARTFWTALMIGDEAWARTFHLGEVLQNALKPNALVAALFGNVSDAYLTELLKAAPPGLRSEKVSVSTAPPGHEEGNFDLLEGDFDWWAKHLKRNVEPLF